MNFIYNIVLATTEYTLILMAWLSAPFPLKGKFWKFTKARRNLLDTIQTEVDSKPHQPLIWIHASSLGEYGVARPIIKELKKQGNCHIALTFFSPTGYSALKRYHPEVDYVLYLPLDTPKNARRFLDIIQPQKAIFIISEYWINYLAELKARHIPTYLISAIISPRAPFMRWYGKVYKKALDTFTHFMVLNESSAINLNLLGYNNLTITGDPLFDNAIAIASTQWHNPIMERFAAHGDVFIAGSISDKKDLSLISSLANRHKDTRFIIVPHEISEEILNEIKFSLDGYALCYSECDEHTDFTDTQTLIIDYLGDLAYLYRYGKWAYVGGGFTPYLHSIIEATVYGLPVAFGPVIHRKVTPNELINLNIGSIVHTEKELNVWFNLLKNNPSELKRIKAAAQSYTFQNSGATHQIIRLLTQP